MITLLLKSEAYKSTLVLPRVTYTSLQNTNRKSYLANFNPNVMSALPNRHPTLITLTVNPNPRTDVVNGSFRWTGCRGLIFSRIRDSLISSPTLNPLLPDELWRYGALTDDTIHWITAATGCFSVRENVRNNSKTQEVTLFGGRKKRKKTHVVFDTTQ